jgi:hypothetical protein
LRRLSYALRRRLAKVLVQNVLWEEFASLQNALKILHGSQAGPWVRPREIYASGIKPPARFTEEP